ncbi:hypothetical protein [Prochlorococcus marinus]|uniref:Uncharacterized protein n=1 Tax=Prochlorococcus marinus XMU1408 TaxID=2213228 RepID=A0A318R2G5_PROMR|nr:hypothetical protein [Prochlorococcus marinus]MBW3042319.1 hypothetical protein [Prochlorococcus marinus str. XMU1408]PYE01722.1 hypothetical protein DNJ73_06385 [Prochlorococcus marinus XMU1408]
MKKFWPRRLDAEGFSIENLARKYREKISRVSTNISSNQKSDDSNFIPIKEDNKKISLASLPTKRGHWANRDFSEYRNVA